MDTLASAYAECGDFKKAVSIETEAYKLSVPPNENFSSELRFTKVVKHIQIGSKRKIEQPNLLDSQV